MRRNRLHEDRAQVAEVRTSGLDTCPVFELPMHQVTSGTFVVGAD